MQKNTLRKASSAVKKEQFKDSPDGLSKLLLNPFVLMVLSLTFIISINSFDFQKMHFQDLDQKAIMTLLGFKYCLK